MSEDFSPADRIRISEDHDWAKSELGTIMQPPGYVESFADGWDGNHRNVPSLKGLLVFYWVKFDESQIDADGDGPYDEAEIDSDYLIRLENQA